MNTPIFPAGPVWIELSPGDFYDLRQAFNIAMSLRRDTPLSYSQHQRSAGRTP